LSSVINDGCQFICNAWLKFTQLDVGRQLGENFITLDPHLLQEGLNILRVLIVLCLEQLVLLQILQLQLVDDFLSVLDGLLVLLRRWVVDDLLDLDVLAFDLLDPVPLLCLVFPVLVELWETRTDIVHEQRW